MASRYFGISRGGTEDSVTQGSSTTSKKLEVVLDLSGNFTKQEVLQGLEYIKQYILKNIWPPA